MRTSGRIGRLVVEMFVLVCFALYARTANGQSKPEAPTAQSAKEPSEQLSKKLLTENDSAKPSGENGAKTATMLAKEVSEAQAPAIVVGFVGGFVGHENMVHSPVQLAARLRDQHPSGVYVKVFENHRREDAHREILKLLDTDHDGTLSAEERKRARIILYGMSWGGSETVALAKELDKEHIPVELTVQVDSVAKYGENDQVIPANVSEAANFYQPNGLIHGQSKIRAADEARTRILGNFRFDYKAKSMRCEKYPWYDKVFAKYHTEIECDPAVWSQVESLIGSKLPPV